MAAVQNLYNLALTSRAQTFSNNEEENENL